jgi:endoglucanase
MRKLETLLLCALILILTGCGSSGAARQYSTVPASSMASSSETTVSEMIASTTATSSEAAVTGTPADFPDASQIAEEMGVGINLGNTMEAYDATGCEKITFDWIPAIGNNTPADYETCWGAPVTTQAMIDGIKAAGFNTVRIPVFWGNMMADDGTYTINSDYIKRVKEIVDYCMNDDMYAVINIHHFDEFIIRRNSLNDCEKIFNTLWTQIAQYFRDYSDKLIFEGFNEYLGGKVFDNSGNLVDLSKKDGYAMTNALNQTFVDAVRASGGNNSERTLIISGYWTNIDLTTDDQFIIPADTARNKLMVSVHYVDNTMYWNNNIGGQKWIDYIDSQCALLTKAFTSKNIPVFIGETTSIYPNERMAADSVCRTSSECLKQVLDKLLDCGFVPVLWDVTDNFYSRNDCKIKSDTDAEVIKSIME